MRRRLAVSAAAARGAAFSENVDDLPAMCLGNLGEVGQRGLDLEPAIPASMCR